MRYLVISLGVVAVVACGDSDGGDGAPDASTIDAGPMARLDAVLDGASLCAGGFTTGPTATDDEGANRLTITASCNDGAEEVILIYAPRPTGAGETAPCAQSTFRSAAGTINCRLNNMVLNDPQGEVVLTGPSGGTADGECACEGDDGGTLRTGGADFLLDVE